MIAKLKVSTLSYKCFAYKVLWCTTNLNLVQIEHVMEQTVKERIRWLISREKIPAYRFEMAWSDYARTNILLCKAYMGRISL